MLVKNHPLESYPEAPAPGEPAFADKVKFLTRGDAYCPPVPQVTCRETHMSQVFLAGDRVYKLKKPVSFPYLDFSTLARRDKACRAEVKLNRRLASDVYRGVTPLVLSEQGFAIGGQGEIIDWLVVMKRLDDSQMLDNVIRERRLHRWQLDRLVEVLLEFYRGPKPVFIAPAAHVAELWRGLAYNRRVLLDPRLSIPPGSVRRIDAIQRRFVSERAELLAERGRKRY